MKLVANISDVSVDGDGMYEITGYVWFDETGRMPLDYGYTVTLTGADGKVVSNGKIERQGTNRYYLVRYRNLQSGSYRVSVSVLIDERYHDPDKEKYPYGNYSATARFTINSEGGASW